MPRGPAGGCRCGGAAAGRFIDVAVVGQDALQDALHRGPVDLLRLAQRLAAAAEVESPELGGGAEALGEVGREDHDVEQFQQAVLQLDGRVELAGPREVVELACELGHDAAGGVGAAVAAQEKHGHQHDFPAGEEHEVGADGTHRGDHPHHVGQIAGGVLDAADLVEFGQAANGGHVDGAREHGDVVERDVDGAREGDFAEIGVNAFRAQAIVEGRDDGHGAAPNS